MPERLIIFIHGNLNAETQAFKKVINELATKHSNLNIHYRYSDPTTNDIAQNGNVDIGFIDAALIESKVPQRDADYYVCGPQPFMVSIYRELLTWGIPASQVHFEFFGPRQELEIPTGQMQCPV